MILIAYRDDGVELYVIVFGEHTTWETLAAEVRRHNYHGIIHSLYQDIKFQSQHTMEISFLN